MEQRICGRGIIGFGQLKKSEQIFKVKEKIISLVPDAAKKGLTFADIRSVAASAERLNVNTVRVNLSTVKTFKIFAPSKNICCVVGGETSCESVVNEIKLAVKIKADWAELYVPVFDIKNRRVSALKKMLKTASKKFSGKVFVTTDFSYISAEEYIFLCRSAIKRGINCFCLPEDFTFAERVKEELPACRFSMRADSLLSFEKAYSFGTVRFVTACTDLLASEIIEKTESVN